MDIRACVLDVEGVGLVALREESGDRLMDILMDLLIPLVLGSRFISIRSHRRLRSRLTATLTPRD